MTTIRVMCDDQSRRKGRVATIAVLGRRKHGWSAEGWYRPHSNVWHVPKKARRTLADDEPMTVGDEVDRGARSLSDLEEAAPRRDRFEFECPLCGRRYERRAEVVDMLLDRFAAQ